LDRGKGANMGMPISFNQPIPQIIPTTPVVPQSNPRKDEETYKLDSLKMHETRMPEVTYSLESLVVSKGLLLNTKA